MPRRAQRGLSKKPRRPRGCKAPPLPERQKKQKPDGRPVRLGFSAPCKRNFEVKTVFSMRPGDEKMQNGKNYLKPLH